MKTTVSVITVGKPKLLPQMRHHSLICKDNWLHSKYATFSMLMWQCSHGAYDLQDLDEDWSNFFFFCTRRTTFFCFYYLFILKKYCCSSPSGCTAGSSFLFVIKVTKAPRGHEGRSKEPMCDHAVTGDLLLCGCWCDDSIHWQMAWKVGHLLCVRWVGTPAGQAHSPEGSSGAETWSTAKL